MVIRLREISFSSSSKSCWRCISALTRSSSSVRFFRASALFSALIRSSSAWDWACSSWRRVLDRLSAMFFASRSLALRCMRSLLSCTDISARSDVWTRRTSESLRSASFRLYW